MSWSFLSSVSSVKIRDVRFVDIRGIDYHHCLHFLFMINLSSYDSVLIILYDIAEILLKVALNTIKQTNKPSIDGF